MIQRSVLIAILMQIMIINECVAKRRICGEALYRHLVRVCTFGYETAPCFKSPLTPSIAGPTSSAKKSKLFEPGLNINDKYCQVDVQS